MVLDDDDDDDDDDQSRSFKRITKTSSRKLTT